MLLFNVTSEMFGGSTLIAKKGEKTMGLMIAGGATCLILGVCLVWKNPKEWAGIIFGSIISAIFICALMALVALIIGHALPRHYVKTSEIKLVSLRDSSQTEGRFFLGYGTIQSSPSYFFYQETNDGGYRPGNVPASDVIIYEESRQDGIIEMEHTSFTHPYYKWFAILGQIHYRYRFHIPNGSLKKGFTLE